jgi:hypothetical protein
MMEERYTIDDFKETKCCLTCRNWNVDNTLQGRYMYNTCRYMYENFKCAAMFPATWQCKHYDGSYMIDCPFGEREYKEVEHDA